MHPEKTKKAPVDELSSIYLSIGVNEIIYTMDHWHFIIIRTRDTLSMHATNSYLQVIHQVQNYEPINIMRIYLSRYSMCTFLPIDTWENVLSAVPKRFSYIKRNKIFGWNIYLYYELHTNTVITTNDLSCIVPNLKFISQLRLHSDRSVD